jgi:hypothetical protein
LRWVRVACAAKLSGADAQTIRNFFGDKLKRYRKKDRNSELRYVLSGADGEHLRAGAAAADILWIGATSSDYVNRK